MAAPYKHSQSSAKKFGGKPEDYLDIHELMDSTKTTFADNRHRALTHNIWFVAYVLPKIFGHVRTNSDGKEYNVKDVGEYHVLEDFGMQFIPTVQDYLQEMEIQPWMSGGGKFKPSSTPKTKEVEWPQIIEPIILPPYKPQPPQWPYGPVTVID
jgi:hypothetical protein